MLTPGPSFATDNLATQQVSQLEPAGHLAAEHMTAELPNKLDIRMHHELQAGLPLVTNTAKHVANQVPIAGLFGSDDVSSSYSNFHQLKAKDIDGNEVKFADLEGKVGRHANIPSRMAILMSKFSNRLGLCRLAWPCH